MFAQGMFTCLFFGDTAARQWFERIHLFLWWSGFFRICMQTYFILAKRDFCVINCSRFVQERACRIAIILLRYYDIYRILSGYVAFKYSHGELWCQKRHCFSKRGETMYEGFYEKSSGYAMAAGMLLSAMSLLMQMTIRYRRMRGQKAQRRNRSIQGTR